MTKRDRQKRPKDLSSYPALCKVEVRVCNYLAYMQCKYKKNRLFLFILLLNIFIYICILYNMHIASSSPMFNRRIEKINEAKTTK